MRVSIHALRVVANVLLTSAVLFGAARCDEPSETPAAPNESVAPAEPAQGAPSIKDILRRWEAAVELDGAREIQFHRYVYDHAFEIERRSHGTMYFADANRAFIEFRRSALPEGAQSGKFKYDLQSDSSHTWTWDHGELCCIFDDHKLYDRIEFPPAAPVNAEGAAHAASFWFDSARLPFQLFPPGVAGIDVESYLERFEWEYVGSTENGIRLSASPREELDKGWLFRFEVLIHPRTYRTNAIRIVGPCGNRETVFVLTHWNTSHAHRALPNPPRGYLHSEGTIAWHLAGAPRLPSAKPLRWRLPVTAVVEALSEGVLIPRLHFELGRGFGDDPLLLVEGQLPRQHVDAQEHESNLGPVAAAVVVEFVGPAGVPLLHLRGADPRLARVAGPVERGGDAASARGDLHQVQVRLGAVPVGTVLCGLRARN
jgi:hypothetical protein